MPRLGKYNKRVIIKEPTKIKDDLGGYADGYKTYGERWAAVEMPSGSDAVQGEVLQSTNIVKVFLRYDAGIKPEMIVEIQDPEATVNPQLLIKAVLNPDYAKVQTVLECTSYKGMSGGR